VIQLTLVQLIAMIAGGPAAMILTVLVGILVNNSVNKTNIEGLTSDVQRIEGSLRSELQRVEGVLTAKLDALETRMKALEDQGRATLVRG